MSFFLNQVEEKFAYARENRLYLPGSRFILRNLSKLYRQHNLQCCRFVLGLDMSCSNSDSSQTSLNGLYSDVINNFGTSGQSGHNNQNQHAGKAAQRHSSDTQSTIVGAQKPVSAAKKEKEKEKSKIPKLNTTGVYEIVKKLHLSVASRGTSGRDISLYRKDGCGSKYNIYNILRGLSCIVSELDSDDSIPFYVLGVKKPGIYGNNNIGIANIVNNNSVNVNSSCGSNGEKVGGCAEMCQNSEQIPQKTTSCFKPVSEPTYYIEPINGYLNQPSVLAADLPFVFNSYIFNRFPGFGCGSSMSQLIYSTIRRMERTNSQEMTAIVFIGDGVLTDSARDVRALVTASHYPISIHYIVLDTPYSLENEQSIDVKKYFNFEETLMGGRGNTALEDALYPQITHFTSKRGTIADEESNNYVTDPINDSESELEKYIKKNNLNEEEAMVALNSNETIDVSNITNVYAALTPYERLKSLSYENIEMSRRRISNFHVLKWSNVEAAMNRRVASEYKIRSAIKDEKFSKFASAMEPKPLFRMLDETDNLIELAAFSMSAIYTAFMGKVMDENSKVVDLIGEKIIKDIIFSTDLPSPYVFVKDEDGNVLDSINSQEINRKHYEEKVAFVHPKKIGDVLIDVGLADEELIISKATKQSGEAKGEKRGYKNITNLQSRADIDEIEKGTIDIQVAPVMNAATMEAGNRAMLNERVSALYTNIMKWRIMRKYEMIDEFGTQIFGDLFKTYKQILKLGYL